MHVRPSIFLDQLNDRNPRVRARAVDALGGLVLESDRVVPALTERLTDPSRPVRSLAIPALIEYGPAATSAVRMLHLFIPDSDLSDAASNAIMQIAPWTFTNALPQ